MFQFHAKYKNKSFEEISELVKNDKKIMQTFIRTLNHPSTSQEKKNEIQQFIDYYNQPTLQIQENSSFKITELSINITKIERIFHISDIHIRLYNRQKEYQDVFQKLYQYIKQNSHTHREIIIITGDLLHSKNNLSPESILITQHFLINLAAIAPTFLIAGNHDAMLTNNQREDSITAIVQNIRIPNFFYLRNSGVYFAANVAIAVCSILDNQWIHANSFQLPPKIHHKIALYHGGVGIVDTGVGHRLRGEKLVSDFDGYDFTLLGDIHKYQWLVPKRMAYASSLIAQNFSEFQDPHGVLVWNLETLDHIYHPIENPCGFFVLNMTNNQLFVNNTEISKNDIPNYLQNITASLQIKLNIQNCSHDFITEIKQKIQNISNDAKIIPNYLANTNLSSRRQEDSIAYDDSSLQQLLIQHLQKNNPNISTNELQFITQKYQNYASNAAIMNERNMARWELIDLKFSNLFGYGPNNFIDFQRFSEKSTIGIIAPNSYGKSSLIDIILFALFSKFSRTRGTSISKDIINIGATNFSVRLRFKIGGDIYTIQKEGKREQSDKIKITQNQLLKQSTDSADIINMTDENRLKTDKIIGELIGSYDDMTFTNIQLQNRNQSFKDMTDKDRKDYLYKILKLDVWNHMVEAIKNDMKPMKAHITYLEKTIENINIESSRENMDNLRLKIMDHMDIYEQQLYEKEINLEKIGGNMSYLSSNEIAQSRSQFAAIGRKLANLHLIPNSQKIKKLFTENEAWFLKNLEKLETEKNSLKLIGFFSPNAKIRPIDLINPELDAAKQELKEAQKKYKYVSNDAPILTPEMMKKNDRIMEVIREKITTMESDLKKYNEINIKKFQQNESHYRKLFIQKNIRESIVTIIANLSSHEYDPNCKFCVSNPIVQQKEKKEKELVDINTKIFEIEKLITFPIEEHEIEIYAKQNEELSSLREILQIKRDKLQKMEDEKESSYGRSIIHRLETQINTLQMEYVHSEQNFQINEKNKEIQAEIDRITMEIKELRLVRDKSLWVKEYQDLLIQEKIYDEFQPQYENLEILITNYEKTRYIRERIEKNDRIIADTTIQMGKIQQQIVQARDEIQKFEKITGELLEKIGEYKMMKILEDSLNKDGLPLQILRNYLVPITDEINGIIRPFISRKICLRVEEDELILDSFPNEGADKSVFMHGGMESFILDIAFKITLSNFAKLPKCNILFLDEGISAFDGERLANIDILFSFIQNYFPKTVLITHLDSVKENIQEKIMITKENGLSKIECFYIL
jgi:DNA repair exonuclease SbcCD ATPase subunit/DNA repair exonuclease SbcCD nuclease subunit